MDILLLTKPHHWGKLAVNIAKHIFERVHVVSGMRTDPFPEEAISQTDAMISFLGPWIVPSEVLERQRLAINFHPGNRHYPGIGCYNFALYDEVTEFGCACHHMATKVDSGPIIDERNFPISPMDTVESLQLKAFAAMLGQFLDICSAIRSGEQFDNASGAWTREPYTRKQLDELSEVSLDMSAEEFKRRIRATYYPGFEPKIDIEGISFVMESSHRVPLPMDF